MRPTVSRTTPGEISRWRGMFAECSPHGHTHLVWDPSSETTRHLLRRNAAATARRRMALRLKASNPL
jgi:hypothetical protein